MWLRFNGSLNILLFLPTCFMVHEMMTLFIKFSLKGMDGLDTIGNVVNFSSKETEEGI